MEKFSRIFKNTLLERVFEKMVFNLSILEGIFEAEFQRCFFCQKNFQRNFYRKIEGELNFWRKSRKVKLKGISLKIGFSGDRNRVLSRPRYRPPTPVLVDSEVRGTTLQKLIVVGEVRGTTPPS